MNIPSNVRRIIYITAIVLAVVLAGIVVFAGSFTEEQLFGVIDLASKLFGGFVGLLALINITQDE